MRCCVLLCLAAVALPQLCGAQGFRLGLAGLGSQPRYHLPASEINCFDLAMKSTAITPIRIMSEGFRTQKRLKAVEGSAAPAAAPPTAAASLNTHEIQKRFDHLFSESDDLAKEHAKLVQDINSLRQVVFIAPLFDENRDYEDSIYHEIIETSTTTAKPKPTTTTPAATTARARPKSTGIPILLLGGASQRQNVKAVAAPKLSKPTISLVGSSMIPLVKHPYPFVGQATSLRPFKICMPPTPMMLTTTRRPSLWSRLLSLFPRLTG